MDQDDKIQIIATLILCTPGHNFNTPNLALDRAEVALCVIQEVQATKKLHQA